MWANSYAELIAFPTYCKEHQKEIHSKENNSEHIAVNVDEDSVRQIKIDGDILPADYNQERRADYLVLDETKKTAYLIELKGPLCVSVLAQPPARPALGVPLLSPACPLLLCRGGCDLLGGAKLTGLQSLASDPGFQPG